MRRYLPQLNQDLVQTHTGVCSETSFNEYETPKHWNCYYTEVIKTTAEVDTNHCPVRSCTITSHGKNISIYRQHNVQHTHTYIPENEEAVHENEQLQKYACALHTYIHNTLHHTLQLHQGLNILMLFIGHT